jgi:hypothetical protein
MLRASVTITVYLRTTQKVQKSKNELTQTKVVLTSFFFFAQFFLDDCSARMNAQNY